MLVNVKVDNGKSAIRKRKGRPFSATVHIHIRIIKFKITAHSTQRQYAYHKCYYVTIANHVDCCSVSIMNINSKQNVTGRNGLDVHGHVRNQKACKFYNIRQWGKGSGRRH